MFKVLYRTTGANKESLFLRVWLWNTKVNVQMHHRNEPASLHILWTYIYIYLLQTHLHRINNNEKSLLCAFLSLPGSGNRWLTSKPRPLYIPPAKKPQSSEQNVSSSASAQRNTSSLSWRSLYCFAPWGSTFPTLWWNRNFLISSLRRECQYDLGERLSDGAAAQDDRQHLRGPLRNRALSRRDPRQGGGEVQARAPAGVHETGGEIHASAPERLVVTTRSLRCVTALWSHCNTSTITQQPLNY